MQTSNPEGAVHAATTNYSTQPAHNVETGQTAAAANNGSKHHHQHSSQSQTSHEDYPDEGGQWGSIKKWALGWRGSRRLVLVIVAIALLLDNMLLTVVGKCSIF